MLGSLQPRSQHLLHHVVEITVRDTKVATLAFFRRQKRFPESYP